MPTTKRKISEQVQRIYARYVDRENIEPVLYKEEVMLLVEQSINTVLQADTMAGKRINRCDVPQSSLVKYSITVTDGVATLPAFPLNLEYDMGVWEIVDPTSPLVLYIPVPMQMAKIMQGTVVSALEQQIGFYRYGDKIHFLSTPASPLDLYLLVSDLSQLQDNDPLPLAADQEYKVIVNVLQALGLGQIAANELRSINNAEDLTQTASE
jgi:hypothetical protein